MLLVMALERASNVDTRTTNSVGAGVVGAADGLRVITTTLLSDTLVTLAHVLLDVEAASISERSTELSASADARLELTVLSKSVAEAKLVSPRDTDTVNDTVDEVASRLRRPETSRRRDEESVTAT